MYTLDLSFFLLSLNVGISTQTTLSSFHKVKFTTLFLCQCFDVTSYAFISARTRSYWEPGEAAVAGSER